ncbi:TetR/AcrR family transcriptional regulator [Leucobacter musarum]|uniref:TetR/AcrR family transcriptional regulator n=1 Tax=Leucobacter musarum TaxID=1930747 RepID=UPI0006A7BA1A|nr:TetR/AcrR family transcriptional regulator [Leucobacter musarum]
MSIIEAAPPEGLRARKRRRTENAIESSAVALALELGVENVTVDAICERADISRSTFFNYFPSRDDAIVGRAIEIPEGDLAFSVLDSTPDNLPLGLFRLLFAAIGHRNINAEVARDRLRLMTEQLEAGRLTMVSLLESGYQLNIVATAWLRARPEHAKLDSPERESMLALALVHGAMSAQMAVWSAGSGDTDADESDFMSVAEEYRKLLG